MTAPETISSQVDTAEPAAEQNRPAFTLTEHVRVLTDENSPIAESVRALRGNLLAHHVKLGRRTLTVCSPVKGAGCSFIAANLAVAMAQAGVNTLLVDANLRDPNLDAFITIDQPTRGLTDCLGDPTLPLRQAVHQVQPNLSVLYSGTPTNQPSDLLSRDSFRTLAGQLLRDYELTIVDTPPSNQNADARRIASVFRHAIVVACKDRTYLKDVRTLIDELQSDGSDVVGTYLNDY